MLRNYNSNPEKNLWISRKKQSRGLLLKTLKLVAVNSQQKINNKIKEKNENAGINIETSTSWRAHKITLLAVTPQNRKKKHQNRYIKKPAKFSSNKIMLKSNPK